jgi:hypothetical protein
MEGVDKSDITIGCIRVQGVANRDGLAIGRMLLVGGVCGAIWIPCT